MNILKRNAVVAAVVLFVCVALYLSWSYSREEEAMSGLDGDGEVYTLLDVVDAAKTVSPSPTPSASPGGEPDTSGQLGGYFDEHRLSRQKARDGALTILRDLAAQDNISDEDRARASGEISNLASQALTEATVEGLVVSKGFDDCVVYMSGDKINVIVASPSDGLTPSDVVKIQDIVITETSFVVADIQIMEAAG